MNEHLQDKIRGVFLGTAIGDSLFVPVETKSSVWIAENHGRITDYTACPPDHKFMPNHPKGSYTDDTILTLAIAESLIEKRCIDLDDIAKKHIEALDKYGDRGFGGTTREAIANLKNGIHWSKSGITATRENNRGRGNGTVMKIAPIALYLWLTDQDGKLQKEIYQLSEMTHADPLVTTATRIHINFLINCLPFSFKSDRDFLGNALYNLKDEFYGDVAHEKIRAEIQKNPELSNQIVNTHIIKKEMLERIMVLERLPIEELESRDFIKLFGRGNCEVYNSLPFSYAFFLRDPHNINALYDVGNAGGDTDTNASIVGGLLGALNGASIFPEHLINGLAEKNYVLDVAERFIETFVHIK